MAKNNTLINDDDDQPKTTVKTEKKVWVKFLSMVRGDFGAFDENQEVEISEALAKKLSAEKLCKLIQAPKAEYNDEDY